MKKKVFGRKFSRERDSRRALFRSLTKALIDHGSIKPTTAKAKAIQGDLDKFVNLAKEDSVAKKRQLYALFANDRSMTEALFKIAKLNLSKRRGGYTRIINLPSRRGDAAEMVRLEWVEKIEMGEEKKEIGKKSKEKEPEKKVIKAKPKKSKRN